MTRAERLVLFWTKIYPVFCDNQSWKKLAAALARSFGNLGGDARLLLLELARDEMEEVRLDTDKEQNYLPHIIGVLMKEFDDWRVNDIALQLVGDSRTPAPG